MKSKNKLTIGDVNRWYHKCIGFENIIWMTLWHENSFNISLKEWNLQRTSACLEVQKKNVLFIKI